MNNYNFDGHQDGDWEERGDLFWNEFDWQLFLNRQQKEVSRFLSLYHEYIQEDNRMDTVAIKMGWDLEDWLLNGEDEDDSETGAISGTSEDTPEIEDLDPYTLHRHPVFIAMTALYADLNRLVEHLLVRHQHPLQMDQVWRFARTLNDGERNAILGLQALDLADYMLSVCHLKMVLRAVNDSMAVVDNLSRCAAQPESMHKALMVRLFDLRELSLRVMYDCREEDRRGFRDDSND
ncbi:MAG: hypothetical protein LR015_06545 [Verrucomicrobia bacterium]|nr:hypothetical protein [Verrucomicrobiota bacterium]